MLIATVVWVEIDSVCRAQVDYCGRSPLWDVWQFPGAQTLCTTLWSTQDRLVLLLCWVLRNLLWQCKVVFTEVVFSVTRLHTRHSNLNFQTHKKLPICSASHTSSRFLCKPWTSLCDSFRFVWMIVSGTWRFKISRPQFTSCDWGLCLEGPRGALKSTPGCGNCKSKPYRPIDSNQSHIAACMSPTIRGIKCHCACYQTCRSGVLFLCQ